MLLALISPISASINIISQGDTIFIGEQGLDVTQALGGANQIAYWASGTTPDRDKPTDILTVKDRENLFVAPSNFVGKTGIWYRWDKISKTPDVAFIIEEPFIDIQIWDGSNVNFISDKEIPRGHFGNFRIYSNLYPITSRLQYHPYDGFIKINVMDNLGTKYNELFGANNLIHEMDSVSVTDEIDHWIKEKDHDNWMAYSDGWNTAAVDEEGNPYYLDGIYLVWAESNANSMKDNYLASDGTYYTGKTITPFYTVTIVEDSIKIETSNDIVTRGNPFSLTVTGNPHSLYYVWVKGTGSMSGESGNRPPVISPGQSCVYQDDPEGPYTIGYYQYDGGGEKFMRDDVPPTPDNGTNYYAQIETNENGTRTIGFRTTKETKPGKYTIRVEKLSRNEYISDEIGITVQ